MTQTHFFQVGGTLSEDAPSYIERPADKALQDALANDELCLVLAPRQTGKSSLMVHALAKLKEKHTAAATIDLQPLGSEKDAAQWFNDVVYQIERSLKLETDSAEWWQQHQRMGATQRFMRFLEEVVLVEVQAKVVLFFDEVDSVLSLPFADDFFTTLRSFYNRRATEADFKRLSFVLLGVASPSEFIQDRKRTPFNIGTEIVLTDFDADSTQYFREVLGDNAQALIDRIFYWTDGQPFLVQTLAAEVGAASVSERNQALVDKIVEDKFLKAKLQSNTHLRFMQDYLLGDAATLRALFKVYRQVLAGKKVARDSQSPLQNRLKLAGVVKVEDKQLKPRNRLYAQVFNADWVKQHKPRDVERWFGVAASFVLLSLLSWLYLIQPLFFPRFPVVAEIVRYSAEPSVEFELALNDTNVSRVSLGDEVLFADDSPVVLAQQQSVRHRMGGLPKGEHVYSLKMVGGLLDEVREIPVKVVYYPLWEVRQFPDKRLEELTPIVEVEGKTFRLKNVLNGKIIFEDELETEISVTQLSVDRKLLLIGDKQGGLKLFNIAQYEAIKNKIQGALGIDSDIKNAKEKNDKEKIKSLEEQKQALLASLWKGFSGHDVKLTALAFASDNRTFISAAKDGSLKLWSTGTEQLLRDFTGHQVAINALVISDDGRSLYSAGDDKGIKVWNILTGQLSVSFNNQTNAVTALALQGGLLLVGDVSGVLTLWNTQTKQPLTKINAHQSSIKQLAIDQKGSNILTGSKNGEIKIWNIYTGDLLSFNLKQPLKNIRFFANNELLFSQAINNEITVWKFTSEEKFQVYTGHKGPVSTALAFSPKGDKIASGGRDGTIKIWDANTGALLESLVGNKNETWSLEAVWQNLK